MNDLVTKSSIKDLALKYEGLSDEELKFAILRCCGNYYESIAELAAAVRVADARGLDLSDVTLEIYPQIRKVADGAVLPEVVTMFGWKKTVYDRVAALSCAEQEKIVKDGHVPVVVLGPDGKTTIRMMNPTKMRPKQLAQVFNGEQLRDEAGQNAFIDEARLEARKRIPEQAGRFKIDEKLRKAKRGRFELTFDEINELHAAINPTS